MRTNESTPIPSDPFLQGFLSVLLGKSYKRKVEEHQMTEMLDLVKRGIPTVNPNDISDPRKKKIFNEMVKALS
jgi:hypothetical protein